MKNLNPYCSRTFEKHFKNHAYTIQLLTQPYTDLIWEDTFKQRHTDSVTGRHHAYRRIMYMATFYYLQFLEEVNPINIYDIGCGANIFKEFIPNLIGISGPNIYNDDETVYGDEIGKVNDAYIVANTNRFESAFSINALHFTNFKSLQNIIQGFITMIKPGGRGYIALNIARLDDYSGQNEMQELFEIVVCSKDNSYNYKLNERSAIDAYIRNVIDQLNSITIMAFEILPQADEYIDGNIRLVFEKDRND